ncbi:hypothetical protein [Nocardia inohanensis]|uniref:hypothetical protein n=1 Tax=Nocardia inohanensis TaxID=209246 RepID=UPI0008340006|nr:hypothetical protein [Nocardia inohanensis]
MVTAHESPGAAGDSGTVVDRAFAALLVFCATLALAELVAMSVGDAQDRYQSWYLDAFVYLPPGVAILLVGALLVALVWRKRFRPALVRGTGAVAVGLLFGNALWASLKLSVVLDESLHLDRTGLLVRFWLSVILTGVSALAGVVGVLSAVVARPHAAARHGFGPRVNRPDRLLGALLLTGVAAALAGTFLTQCYLKTRLEPTPFAGGEFDSRVDAFTALDLLPGLYIYLPWLGVWGGAGLLLAIGSQYRLTTPRPELRTAALLLAGIGLGPAVHVLAADWATYRDRHEYLYRGLVDVGLGPGCTALIIAGVLLVAALAIGFRLVTRPPPDPDATVAEPDSATPAAATPAVPPAAIEPEPYSIDDW